MLGEAGYKGAPNLAKGRGAKPAAAKPKNPKSKKAQSKNFEKKAPAKQAKPKKEAAAQGSGFSVVINLGDPAKPAVTIEQVDPMDTPPPYLKLVPEAVLDVPAYG
jgi:hypothetical protein